MEPRPSPAPALAPAASVPASDSPSASRFIQARTPSRARDYVALAKPEITFLVVLSALAGYALGSPHGVDGVRLAATLVGVALTAAGGAAFNHVFERAHDAGMHRTADRPIPSGRVSARAASYYAMGLIAAGAGLLCPLTNWLTAALALGTIGLYLGVYTPLKRRTPANTLVGTIPGALPALGGYAAATGTLGAGGWAVFALLVLWQMPHFLALAWMYRKDYARGGFAMSTVTDETGTATAWTILACALLTVAASLLPLALAPEAFGAAPLSAGSLLAGAWPARALAYGAAALGLGAYFVVPTVRFLAGERSNADAKAVLKASVVYIPLIVAALALAVWV